MIFDPFPVFLPAEYRVKFATDAWERREAAALRRQSPQRPVINPATISVATKPVDTPTSG